MKNKQTKKATFDIQCLAVTIMKFLDDDCEGFEQRKVQGIEENIGLIPMVSPDERNPIESTVE